MNTINIQGAENPAPIKPFQYLNMPGFWGIIIVFSLLLGIFLARVATPYQRADYMPHWNQAEWITPSISSAVAYYRKEITLNSTPNYAYLQIMAIDSMEIYINGLLLQQVEKPSTAVFDIIDVAPYLAPGRNIIAIRVESKTIDEPPALIANLHWQESPGTQHALSTNNTWHLSLRREHQNNGNIAWYEIDFDDINWAYAATHNIKNEWLPYAIHPWATPQLFNSLPKGEWMWGGTTETTGTSFQREFDLGKLHRREIKNAWLAIASTTPYVITINGAGGPTIDASDQYMDVYNIGSFLFAGNNTITIDTSTLQSDGRIAISAMVQTSDSYLDLSSDAQWRIRTSRTNWQPAIMIGDLDAYPYIDKTSGHTFYTPALRLSDMHLPGGLLLRHLASSIPWITGVFIISLTIIVIGFSSRQLTASVVKAGMLPWILSDILLCIIFLLPFDIRITEADIFNLPVAFILSIFTPLFFILTLREVESGQSR